MAFHPFEATIPHIAYAVLGGFVVFFGMFSLFIREKLYIGEACWAFVFGVIIGPYGANIFDPRGWGGGSIDVTNTITLEFTRVVLAIGVFAVGVELPKAYMARHWKSLLFLLGPLMTWGWFVSAGLIYALIPGLNFLSSLAIAACLTPTDPILAAAVIGGKYADKHVPAHIRHLLAAESGCNDGAAFPFLFIALYLINDPSTGRAVSDWILLLWLYQVILGIVIGGLLGFGFRHLMKLCERKDLIDRQSYVAQYVALSLLTIGTCTMLGSDDLLAAFSCGTAFAWDGFFNRQTEEAVFSSVIDLLFNIAAFVFVGAWTPFNQFSNPNLTLSVWRLIVIAILVILLRRLPIMIALYKWIPDVKTFREALFSGHFGPMGIGAIFISTLAVGQLPSASNPPQGQTELLAASIQPIVAFMVLCSVAVHGLSIPFFSLGRRVHSVSRTWSRHDTWGARHGQPEWTTHTRRVVPGEEIVINRDSEMERGTLPADEKRLSSRHDSLTVVDQQGEGSASSNEKAEEGSSSLQDEQAKKEDGTDMREENLPDGAEVVAEWKEGAHRVIELRSAPGEEVEVIVQKNAFPEETPKEHLRAAEGAATHKAHEIQETLRQAPHELEEGVEKVQNDIQQGAHDVERKGKELAETARDAMGLSPAAHADEEEEGWMSDHSNGGSSRVRIVDEKRRSRSPKQKPTRSSKASASKTASTSARKRTRRGVLGVRPRGIFKRSHSSDDDDSSSTDERGSAFRAFDEEDRTPGTPASGDRIPHQHFTHPHALLEREERIGRSESMPQIPTALSLRHARIDSIRTSETRRRGSRELSPARSVRWADTEERSGHSTPRFMSSPSTPLPGSEAPSGDEGEGAGEEHDSPSHQVRFQLPEPEDKRA